MHAQRLPLLTYFIALVWLVNGLYCKVLNGVPRHQEIVAEILGNAYAREWTVLIGIAEIVMAIWVLLRYLPKLNAATQIFVIALMNILEFILVPHLLLWGRWNAFFAFLFIGLIFYHGFLQRSRIES